MFTNQFGYCTFSFSVISTFFLKKSCLGGSSEGGTPDSIPNSEVKPFSADGTWTLGPGRVGRRQDTVFLITKICLHLLYFISWGFLMINYVTNTTN